MTIRVQVYILYKLIYIYIMILSEYFYQIYFIIAFRSSIKYLLGVYFMSESKKVALQLVTQYKVLLQEKKASHQKLNRSFLSSP